MQGYFPCSAPIPRAEFATNHLVPPQFPMKGELTSLDSIELFAHRQPKWHHDPAATVNDRQPRPRKSRRGCIRQQPSWWYGLHPNTHDEFTPAADAAKARPTRLQEGGDDTKSLLTPPWSKSDTFGERPLANALPDKLQLPVRYDWSEANRLQVAREHRLKKVFHGKPPQRIPKPDPGPPAPPQARNMNLSSSRVNWAGLNGFHSWHHGMYKEASKSLEVPDEIDDMLITLQEFKPNKIVNSNHAPTLRGIF